MILYRVSYSKSADSRPAGQAELLPVNWSNTCQLLDLPNHAENVKSISLDVCEIIKLNSVQCM